MIYIIWDWWKEDNNYYCITYKDDKLYFSEAREVEKKSTPFMGFIRKLFKKGINGEQSK